MTGKQWDPGGYPGNRQGPLVWRQGPWGGGRSVGRRLPGSGIELVLDAAGERGVLLTINMVLEETFVERLWIKAHNSI